MARTVVLECGSMAHSTTDGPLACMVCITTAALLKKYTRNGSGLKQESRELLVHMELQGWIWGIPVAGLYRLSTVSLFQDDQT